MSQNIYQQMYDQAGLDSAGGTLEASAALAPEKCGSLIIITGASGETNTAPDPLKEDIRIRLTMKTDGGGDRVITASTAINAAGNTIMTFADAGDTIELVSIVDGSDFKWSVASNEGVALS